MVKISLASYLLLSATSIVVDAATSHASTKRASSHVGLAGASSNNQGRSNLVVEPVNASSLKSKSKKRSMAKASSKNKKRDLNSPSKKSITLPLKRAHDPKASVANGAHPMILLQQHINRGTRRLAHMTRQQVDNMDAHLENALVKRFETAYGVQDAKLVKRQFEGVRGGLAMVWGKDKAAAQKESQTFTSRIAQALGFKGRVAAANQKGKVGAKAGEDNADGFDEEALAALLEGTLTEASDPTAKNSVPMTIEADDIGYFAPIELGTPPKTFQILLDTGSADFWVPSQVCTTCGNHTILGSSTSSSFKASNQQFQVTYGTGNVAGQIIQDDVSIADGALKLKAHTFGVTTQESVEFSGAPFDGLMGTALSKLSNQQVPTPIENLVAQNQIDAGQVGYRLARFTDGKNDGETTFGGVDGSKFDGDLTIFKNVNANGFWEGAIDDIAVDGKSIGIKKLTGILDTGTTLIVMPEAAANAVHEGITGAKPDGQGGFTLPCDTDAVLSFTFGGKEFTMQPQDLTFVPVDQNDLTGDCVSSISAGNIGGANSLLIGDAFLKNTYYATDIENNSMGLAQIP